MEPLIDDESVLLGRMTLREFVATHRDGWYLQGAIGLFLHAEDFQHAVPPEHLDALVWMVSDATERKHVSLHLPEETGYSCTYFWRAPGMELPPSTMLRPLRGDEIERTRAVFASRIGGPSEREMIERIERELDPQDRAAIEVVSSTTSTPRRIRGYHRGLWLLAAPIDH